MAFMVETCWPYRPTQWALERAQPDYDHGVDRLSQGEAAVTDETNDPARTSWVRERERAAISRSRTCRSESSPTASGRRGRELRSATSSSTLPRSRDLLDDDWREDLSQPVLNAWLARGHERAARASRRGCRSCLRDERYRDDVEPQLIGQSEVRMHVPCLIGDYTDFYVGIHHATNVGKQFRPDNPLLPNYKYVPIGYHGRASSVRPSGEPVIRPSGQRKPPDAEAAGIRPEPPPRLRARAWHLDRRRQRPWARRSRSARRPSISPAIACSTTGRRATCRRGNISRSVRSSPRIS